MEIPASHLRHMFVRGSRIPGRPLQRKFRRVLTYKQRNRYNISLIGLDTGPTLRARTSQVEIRDTSSKKTAEACPAKIAREKIPTSYQDVALRIAVNADFRFVTQHCLKNRRRKSLIFGDDFRPKKCLFGVHCQTNGDYKVKIGRCNWFVCFHNYKIYHLVLWTNVQ